MNTYIFNSKMYSVVYLAIKCFFLVLVCHTVMFWLFQKTDKISPDSERERYEYLFENRNSINALALGSSHNLAIDFGVLGLQGYTIWEPGQDIFECEYQLKSLSKNIPNLQTVFINISFNTLRRSRGALVENRVDFSKPHFVKLLNKYPGLEKVLITYEWDSGLDSENIIFFDLDKQPRNLKNTYFTAYKIFENRIHKTIKDRRKICYQYLPSWGWVEGDFLRFISARFFPYFGNDVFSKTLDVLNQNSTEISKKSSNYDKYGQRKIEKSDRGQLSLKSMEMHAKKRTAHLAFITGEMLGIQPGLQQSTFDCLTRISSFCKRNRIDLIFYTPPFHREFTKNCDPEIVADTRSIMRKIAQGYGVKYFDFSYDSEFINNLEYFSNSDHLNRNGAAIFSEHFKKKLGLAQDSF
jgi:hypothetical protein